MKELSARKKIEVVRLFLEGLPYEEIARKLGIAKGSVVYIINDFKEGSLPIPPDMAEYADTLRQLAVDLRKHETSIAQARACLKLAVKLKEMGVDSEKAEQWLDICRDISSGTIASAQFVDTALELARLSSEKGLSYNHLVADCEARLRQLSQMDNEIEQKANQLDSMKQETERITKELQSITKAMATAQEAFQKHKDQLKSELDEYLTENKLSWKKVKLVESVIDSELCRAGLSKAQVQKARELVIAAGSLLKLIRKQESTRDKLESEVRQLAQAKKAYTERVGQLRHLEETVSNSLEQKVPQKLQLDAELQSKMAELAGVEKRIADKIDDLYISQLIIDFLAQPHNLENNDLDRLVSIMIALRQNRLGIGPSRVTDGQGKVVCQCQVPEVYAAADAEKVDIDDARKLLALHLAPLVRDKFVLRSDSEWVDFEHKMSERLAFLEGLLAAQ